jgi:hypothetical protein
MRKLTRLSRLFSEITPKAIGLGAAIGQHWEPFISKLLSGVKSQAKKDELIEAFKRLLLEQVMEFSRILASDVGVHG